MGTGILAAQVLSHVAADVVEITDIDQRWSHIYGILAGVCSKFQFILYALIYGEFLYQVMKQHSNRGPSKSSSIFSPNYGCMGGRWGSGIQPVSLRWVHQHKTLANFFDRFALMVCCCGKKSEILLYRFTITVA
jgi:hypothetical protein